MGLLVQPRHCWSKGVSASKFKMGHMGQFAESSAIKAAHQY